MLSLVTYLVTQFVDRFGVEEEQLLQNASFLDDGANWQKQGPQPVDFQDNQVRIHNGPGASQAVFQNLEVDTPAYYRFSYSAETKEVVSTSPEDWALASVAVIYYDDNGERTGSKTLASLVGTESAAHFTEDILLIDTVASIDFAARLYRAGGEFVVSDPIVTRLKELTTYKAFRYFIIAAWVLLLGFIFYAVAQVCRLWQVLILAGLAGVALLGTMMPEAIMTVLTQKVAGLLPESFLVELRSILSRLYGESRFSEAGTEVSKLGHFLIFLCFGLFVGLVWRRCGIYYAIAAILVFSIVTEVLQTLVYGRTTNISDLILDNTGGLIGLVIGVGLAEFIGLFVKTPVVEEQTDYYEEDHFDESYRYRNH